jgi:hypothetical protein
LRIPQICSFIGRRHAHRVFIILNDDGFPGGALLQDSYNQQCRVLLSLLFCFVAMVFAWLTPAAA